MIIYIGWMDGWRRIERRSERQAGVCGKEHLYVQEGKVKIGEIEKKIMEDVKYFPLIGNRENNT